MVCLQPPYTDETRISLQIGDKVAVTRWKKYDKNNFQQEIFAFQNFYNCPLIRYWLYGEIQERGQVQMNPTERRALRGWFPRTSCSPCYVEYEKEE